MRQSPTNVGAYALLITVPDQETIRIGRLGLVHFVPGVYVYVGSALNSLHGRVQRHLRTRKRKYWHIDYLLGASGAKVANVAIRPTVRKIECAMSRALQRKSLSSIQKFGCSDCNCDSHLHRFGTGRRATNAVTDLGFSLL